MADNALGPSVALGAVLLQVHSVTHGSRVNGPGSRAIVHVQGCTLKCPGCFSPHTWEKSGGRAMRVAELLEEIGDHDLTISGGEPVEQLAGVLALVQLHRRARPERTVLMYTGHSEEELNECFPLGLSITPMLRTYGVDGVIAGRYKQELRQEGVPLRSSSNQVYLDLSGRVPEDTLGGPEVEVHIDADGTATMMGFPTKDAVRGFRAAMEG